MCQRFLPEIFAYNGLFPDGIKPLPGLMLTNHQWGLMRSISFEMLKTSVLNMNLKNTDSRLQLYLPGGQWFKGPWAILGQVLRKGLFCVCLIDDGSPAFNPLWPSDTIWWYAAPSHCLNQCWLIVNRLLWQSNWPLLQEVLKTSIQFKLSNYSPHLLGPMSQIKAEFLSAGIANRETW